MNQPPPKKQTARNAFAYLAIVVAIGSLLFFTKNTWLPKVQQQLGVASAATPDDHAEHDHASHSHGDHSHDDHAGHSHSDSEEQDANESTIQLSDQAKRNLKLSSKRAYPKTYWKRMEIPGEIVDRPGLTDRSLTAPIAGVITAVHAHQGDIIKPGDRLVTVRLVSDYLQQSQSDLFKAVREIEIVNREVLRIQGMVKQGIVPEKRLIQLQQDIERQRSQIDAIYQDLITRGFNDAQVADAKQGKFLTSIEIRAPFDGEPSGSGSALNDATTNQNTGSTMKLATLSGTTTASQEIKSQTIKSETDDKSTAETQFFEVQKVVSELGHQVQPGEQIAVLSDHRHLNVLGHAFKREAANLERVMENGWSVGVDFVDDVPENWPKLNQRFKIRHLSNEVDPESRTFNFVVPMENQSRVYEGDQRTSIVWRFRPGQRVRLQIPVEKIEGVLVLPAAAVVRDGAEMYAFQEIGKFYRRFPVHVIYQDRTNVVLANDGSLPVGAEVAQGSAASLNRVLKSQNNEGSKEFHVHADGTVHSNSDH
ncbi:MchE protein [Mariniblastus sp.]|nr:MchE protein [Mariniblastus sp.]